MKSRIASWLRGLANKIDPPSKISYLGDIHNDGRMFVSINDGPPIQYSPHL